MLVPTIAACVIARDEELQLGACLRSVQPLVDETIVLVDSRTCDRTAEVAQAGGAHVHHYRWENSADTRNEALSKAQSDWILSIDADERLIDPDPVKIRELLAMPNRLAYSVLLRPKAGWTRMWLPRLFRNDPRIQFEGIVHGQVSDSVRRLVAAGEGELAESPLLLDHLGYDADQSDKDQGYLPQFLEALRVDPSDSYNWRCLGEVYHRQGEPSKVAECWKTSLRLVRQKKSLSPPDLVTYFDLIQWGLDQGQDVQSLLLEIGERVPDNPWFIWLQGRALMQLRSFEEALPSLERLLDVGEVGEFDRSLSYDSRIFRLFPLQALASCHFQLGNYEASEKYHRLTAAEDSENQLEYRVKIDLCGRMNRRQPHSDISVRADRYRILFVQDEPCIRNYKECRALRSLGHSVSVAYSRRRLVQVLPLSESVYDDTIKISTPQDLWDLAGRFDLVHCHNPPDLWTRIALAGKRPVVHDTHDMVSLADTGDGENDYLEAEANIGAAGRVYVSDYLLEVASRKYGIDRGSSLVIPNHVGRWMLPKSLLPKLSQEDGLTHLVYEGFLTDQPGRMSFLLPFLEELTTAGFQVHIYPSAHACAYRQSASGNPNLHYHLPVSPAKLLVELSRYDFGLMPYATNDRTRLHLDSALPNKMYEYLAAGLPVIARNYQSVREFVDSKQCGFVYDRPEEILLGTKRYGRRRAEPEFFVMEDSIPKLEALYAGLVARWGRAEQRT